MCCLAHALRVVMHVTKHIMVKKLLHVTVHGAWHTRESYDVENTGAHGGACEETCDEHAGPCDGVPDGGLLSFRGMHSVSTSIQK